MLLRLIPGAERFAFSDALAVECRVHHGMTKRDPALLQRIGMARRDAQPGVWIDALYGAIADRQPEVAVITGVRFHDEAEMIRAIGGHLIRVERVDSHGQRYVTDDRDPNHAAEQQIDSLKCDAMLVANSGDLRGLELELKAWLSIVRMAA
jgi:hypothetical protein